MITQNYLIEFEHMDWHHVDAGIRQKEISRDGKRMRLVEFRHRSIENDWCQKGHIGFVIEGSMTINFNGTRKAYTSGNALWIDPGEPNRHRIEMAENESVTLFLIEME